MSKGIGAEVTGKMPFAGKHLVKYMFLQGREAARNGNLKGKAANVFGLGAFAALHAVQLKMGVDAFEHNEHSPVVAGFDALYTTANAMATYTQAYLGLKVLGTRSKATAQAVTAEGMVVDISVSPQEQPGTREIEEVTPLELAVTLGGQALFLASM